MTRPAAVLVVALVLCGCNTSAPPAPALPSGPAWATVGDTCEYSTWTQVAEGQGVGYRFDWGDGDTSDWSEFVPGGTQVLKEHVWTKAGKWPVRSQAEDISGQYSEWSAAHEVNVRPVPGYPYMVVNRIEVGGRPYAIVVSPDGAKVFVANCENGDLVTIRTADDSVIGRVPGTGAWGLALSPSGESLYTVGSGWLYLMTTHDYALRCSTGISEATFRVALPPGTGQVWVPHFHCWVGGRIVVLRASDLTEVTEVEFGSDQPAGIAATPDGRYVYVTLSDASSVAVVSTADYEVVCRIPVGAVPVDIAISPDGRLAFTADYESFSVTAVRTRDNAVLGSVPVGDGPWDVEFDPSGRYVYVACEGDLGAVVDVARLERLPAVCEWAQCVACLPDGSRLYTGGTVVGFPNQN
jgi:YVTN family beta-propeller protein